MKSLRSTPQDLSYFVVDTTSKCFYNADKQCRRNNTKENTELLMHQSTFDVYAVLTQKQYNELWTETDDEQDFEGLRLYFANRKNDLLKLTTVNYRYHKLEF
jgi:hypothetical protein